MYRPDEMALILEQARQEAKKQQLAGTERKTITWDGIIGDRQTIAIGSKNLIFAKISEYSAEVEAKDIKKLVVSVEGAEISMDEYELAYSGSYVTIHFPGSPEDVLCIISADTTDIASIPAGVWFLTPTSEDIYTSRLELETIHPIPQEYIPPLDRLILNGADGNQYALTIIDGAISVAPVTT